MQKTKIIVSNMAYKGWI